MRQRLSFVFVVAIVALAALVGCSAPKTVNSAHAAAAVGTAQLALTGGCPDGSPYLEPTVSEMALPVDISGLSDAQVDVLLLGPAPIAVGQFCISSTCCLNPVEWYLPHDHGAINAADATVAQGGDGLTHYVWVAEAVRTNFTSGSTRIGFDSQTATIPLDGYANWYAFCQAWLTASAYPDGLSYLATSSSFPSRFSQTAALPYPRGTAHKLTITFTAGR